MRIYDSNRNATTKDTKKPLEDGGSKIEDRKGGLYDDPGFFISSWFKWVFDLRSPIFGFDRVLDPR
jgi:hypothetical protein